MDFEIPDPKEFESEDEWMFSTGCRLRDRIEECAPDDDVGRAQVIAAFDAFVTIAVKKGGSCTLTLMALVQLTTEPKRRMELLRMTYKCMMSEVEDDEWSETQASSCCEAAWLQREMALLHERAGDHAAARKCYDDALALSHRIGDLAYTHFISESDRFNDGDAIPIRPRLMEDLARVGKKARNS